MQKRKKTVSGEGNSNERLTFVFLVAFRVSLSLTPSLSLYLQQLLTTFFTIPLDEFKSVTIEMTRLLFILLPIFVLSLTLLIPLVSAQWSTEECPIDLKACNHPCQCGGENYGSCGKGYVCEFSNNDGNWICQLGSRFRLLPPCIVERSQRLTNRNVRRIDQRVHYRALARGGVGGTNRR